ncbi:MAG: translation initiation factor IF-2 [Candidatus Gastranaerophilales bacterium]|nr:translation initiation factor IF-2 [Candidatus Gastranaerophilales bacterium]
MRVHELADELNISAKELMTKVEAGLGMSFKSHSASVTPEAAAKIKTFLTKPEEKTRPKAFIVKKAKDKPKVQTEKQPSEVKSEQNQQVQSEVKIIEQPKMRSKLEIVRPAHPVVQKPKQEVQITPAKPKPVPFQKAPDIPSMIKKNFAKKPVIEPKKEEKTEEKPQEKKRPQKDTVPHAPIVRHIIPQDIYQNQGPHGRKKKKDRVYKNKEEEQERISLEKAVQQKHKKHTQTTAQLDDVTQVVINRPMTINELSEKTRKSPAEIIKFLMLQGILVTVNSPIDIETAKKVAQNFEIEVLDEDIDSFIEEEIEKEEVSRFIENADESKIVKRAPVVTIMGHVDHGKTTLLDSIRASKHKIVSTEVGGITQSIGAYTVWLNERKIVFIDTPGHEAFTQMRARGAQSTDIAILVVAADDGVMPQTIEAINHAKSAGVPIIVAVNKIDKPDANPDKVLQQLTEYSLVPEAWGGQTITVQVSALQGKGIDELLEYILLVADMQELKAVEDCPAMGIVIEANLDKGKGPVAHILIQNGTLHVGDSIVVGNVGGKARALIDDSGRRVKIAGPSTPVEILGLNEVPQAGDRLEAVKNEREMKQIVSERKQKERITRLDAMAVSHVRKDTLSNDEILNLNLIIKANTNGSAEAVSQAIQNVKSSKIVPKIIHVGVGDISEADVMLASASEAIILGFTVKEDSNALLAAEREGVKIKKFDIIYQVLEDIEKTMLSLLAPVIEEVELGKAEVRQIFTIGKTNRIAGCYVTEGKIVRSKHAVVVRGGEEIFTGEIDQLKRFKDDVKEVASGFECGISFYKFNDIQIGDIIEVSTTKEVERSSLE